MATTIPAGSFKTRNSITTFKTAIEFSSSAPTGQVFSFGDATGAISMWVDNTSIYFRAGGATADTDANEVSIGVSPVAGLALTVIGMVRPDGMVGLWIPELQTRSWHDTGSFTAWANDIVGDFAQAATGMPADVVEAGAPTNFAMTEPLSVFYGSMPRVNIGAELLRPSDSFDVPTYTVATSLTNANPIVATAPADIAIGDLLVLIIGFDANTGLNQFTTPAGWTLEGWSGDTASDAYIGVFSKVSDGTEGASVSVTALTIDDAASAYFRIPRGNSVEVVGVVEEGLGATSTAASITALTPNSLAFALIATDGGNVIHSGETAGWTNVVDLDQNGVSGVGLQIYDKTANGATNDFVTTLSESEGYTTFQIAIDPAS